MKKNIVIFLFIICVNIHSFNFIEFFDASSFHYQFCSFLGTDYHPYQDESQNNYLEKNIFKAGWNFKIEENVNIWFDLTYRKRLFSEQLELESTGIIYHKNNWDFIFKSDQLEIGNESEIFIKNQYSSYYDKPIIEDYKFRGFESKGYFGNFNISGMVGGNSFNSAIGKFSLGYSNTDHIFDIYYLYCKRDRIFTYPMHAFGFEILSEINIFQIYNSLVYENMISNLPYHPSHERFVDLSEIIFRPHSNVNLGANFLYTIFDWDTDEEWQLTSFLELIFGETTNTLSYKYWNAGIGFDREINLINSYNILPYWSLASNLSYFNPSIGDDYFIIGFQTKIEYEIH